MNGNTSEQGSKKRTILPTQLGKIFYFGRQFDPLGVSLGITETFNCIQTERILDWLGDSGMSDTEAILADRIGFCETFLAPTTTTTTK